jgi:hypothetical protein
LDRRGQHVGLERAQRRVTLEPQPEQRHLHAQLIVGIARHVEPGNRLNAREAIPDGVLVNTKTLRGQTDASTGVVEGLERPKKVARGLLVDEQAAAPR